MCMSLLTLKHLETDSLTSSGVSSFTGKIIYKCTRGGLKKQNWSQQFSCFNCLNFTQNSDFVPRLAKSRVFLRMFSPLVLTF